MVRKLDDVQNEWNTKQDSEHKKEAVRKRQARAEKKMQKAETLGNSSNS